ncbi:MAG: MBL fold metallo-hydrolase [Erysipelotrichaceae bacterium]|nr:MBL fold metallo-hydrolase [Erysipelotrichaceae bacterium]MBP5279819.1 MBL fold metallo-hydrolase [Erysipelotrichaceae bacterium]
MKIEVNAQSSIRIESDKIIYFDPFMIEEESHDADIIFFSHDHYDHFSIEAIRKVEKIDTVYVIPDSMYNKLGGENVITVNPNEKILVEGYEVVTIPSYNRDKTFHPKDKGYLAYIVTIEGKRVYVAGDCDANEDNLKISCDIALVPIGGHYTMDYKEAAEYINKIRPALAIPTHYGNGIGDEADGVRFSELVDKDIEVQLLLDK